MYARSYEAIRVYTAEFKKTVSGHSRVYHCQLGCLWVALFGDLRDGYKGYSDDGKPDNLQGG